MNPKPEDAGRFRANVPLRAWWGETAERWYSEACDRVDNPYIVSCQLRILEELRTLASRPPEERTLTFLRAWDIVRAHLEVPDQGDNRDDWESAFIAVWPILVEHFG